MRIAYREDGTAVPVYEPGDHVRLVQDEPGPIVMAQAGEWGVVLRNRGVEGLDIRLAGHSRPRTTDIPVAMGIPARIVIPCDELGLRIDLQRDLRRDGGSKRRRA
ncbi:hypothetical protein J5Y09_21030 [Roseomonas sp. PWR1]|uniref:Uncharacterized protein n=1 Tax=Roseomonas nitratireducens TaxID=2820810 RepID=A0ABS4AYH0_9PROT|nr:hypothetical protein [Neoroseomonas nitratireducens]MBP0466425.1 hypothetical protein [Neoroseomonas nitratireducens]